MRNLARCGTVHDRPESVFTISGIRSERSHERPISENSVRTALITMGYTPDVQTWHGFRATARTMLAEVLECDPLVIEAQLAHAVKDANGRAYNRTQYQKQRTEMMQRWADYLDKLATDQSSFASQSAR